MSKFKFNALSFLLTLLTLLGNFPNTSPFPDSRPSPKASTELICHTNHASECYPSVFQPTTKFQVLHDDQSIPPGLHVRMNLATGVKEARLNVPEPEAAHSDLVIVDEPEMHHDQTVLEEPKPPRVRPPRFDADEAAQFHHGMSRLKSSSANDEDIAPTLSDLQELCHSQDWGVALTKDGVATRFLVQVLQDISAKLAIRSLSALLLATAIQNNPEALSAALSHFYDDEWPNSPLDAVILALLHEESPQMLTRIVFLLSALCQDPKQLAAFADADGLRILLTVFDVEHAGQDERDKLRGKIANFMLDHLDRLETVIPEIGDKRAAEAPVKKEESMHSQEDDSQWVVVDNLHEMPMSEVIDDNLSKRAWEMMLGKWRDDLGEAIAIYDRGQQDTGSTTYGSLSDAYAALKKRLEES